MYRSLLVIFLFIYTSSASSDIFGRDNRRELRPTGPYKQLSQAVAVGVINSLWEKSTSDLFSLEVDRLSDFICPDERFADQTSIPYACSGFLVGPDLLVTAGHCAVNFGEVRNMSEGYCEAYTWYFDYFVSNMEDGEIQSVDADNIYKCKEIIYAISDERLPDKDFALIRLDRKVTGRNPLKISNRKVRNRDPLSLIGFPMGMPMKLTDQGRVKSTPKGETRVITSLDAFSGNSGSPVFNSRREVIGVLISGEPNSSTYRDAKNSCDRYNYCDEFGKNCIESTLDPDSQGFPETGTDVFLIDSMLDLINENI
jgi:V8-like Glu-specific endopeptidase